MGGNMAYLLKDRYHISGAARKEIKMPQIMSSVYDLLDTKKLQAEICCVKPDVIVHTAALVNVDYCEVHQDEAYQMNTALTKTLSDICFEKGIRLVYISTDSVFDGKKPGLYGETDDTDPQNAYARTKREGELYVNRFSGNMVIRTNIYGFNIQDKYSIGEWMLYALSKGQSLDLFDDIQFSPILVNELTHIISLMVEEEVSGLYHICATGSISKYEFGIQLKEIFGIRSGKIRKRSSDQFAFRAARPKNMGLDNTRIRQKLKIEISDPVQGLKQFQSLYRTKYPDILRQCRQSF